MNLKYPYYHELQLPMINDYYFNKSKLNTTNSDTIQTNEMSLPKTGGKYVAIEQIDLNAVYKSDKRHRRTSYNKNFQNIDEILANYKQKNNEINNLLVEKEPISDEMEAQNFTPTKRTNWFTKSQINNSQNLVNRKSFFRPKTPILTLDARRKNLPESFARDQKYTTATTLENLSKRTGELIERFKNKYAN